MEEKRIDKTKEDENSCKKALLTRYLEDQVLYNLHTPESEPCNDIVPDDHVFEDRGLRSRKANTVIVKVNDEIAALDSHSHTCSQRVRRKLSKDLRPVISRSAKLSRSLDDGEFKSLYLDIPTESEISTGDGRSSRLSGISKPQPHLRKYSDCSNNRTKYYEIPSFIEAQYGRYNADHHNHPTNTLSRGMLKKLSLPMFGGNEKSFGKKQYLSFSGCEGSIQDFSSFKDGDTLRASVSSFRSSCSSFPEIEFNDSDYDRSCTSSPTSPFNPTCRFPPINSELNSL